MTNTNTNINRTNFNYDNTHTTRGTNLVCKLCMENSEDSPSEDLQGKEPCGKDSAGEYRYWCHNPIKNWYSSMCSIIQTHHPLYSARCFKLTTGCFYNMD